MEKANKAGGADSIAVAVTRLGADPIAVKLTDDRTVRKALELAGVATTGRTEYFVDGQRAEMDDILQEGDVLSLVTPKQAGSK